MAADLQWVEGVVVMVGHFFESQLVRSFYFYAPSCPAVAGGLSPTSPALYTLVFGGWGLSFCGEGLRGGLLMVGVWAVVGQFHSTTCVFLWIHAQATWSFLHYLNDCATSKTFPLNISCLLQLLWGVFCVSACCCAKKSPDGGCTQTLSHHKRQHHLCDFMC